MNMRWERRVRMTREEDDLGCSNVLRTGADKVVIAEANVEEGAAIKVGDEDLEEN